MTALHCFARSKHNSNNQSCLHHLAGKHPTNTPKISANKLANVKRDSIKHKSLTDLVLAIIHEKARPNITDSRVEDQDQDPPEGTTPDDEEPDEHQEAIQQESENQRETHVTSQKGATN